MLEKLTGVASLVVLASLAACSGDDGSSGAGGGSTSTATSTGAGGAGGGVTCPSPPIADALTLARETCTFAAGSKVEGTLGVDAAARAAIPITHVILVAQENRSFDHYFGRLPTAGQPDAGGWPAAYVNPDAMDVPVAPYHLKTTCLPIDPPHQWSAMHAGWNDGAMDGFVKSAADANQDGHFVIGYYEDTDLPFYYWLANTFAIADRYFGSALGGTWANRDYLYAATSMGVKSTGQATIDAPTIFDALDAAGVGWGVYTDGNPRQDCLGWFPGHKGVAKFSALIDGLTKGTLPPVSFVDPGPAEDEHPPNDVQLGEAWSREIFEAAVKSPLWPKLAILYTYDESGGMADHVPPPKACLASPSEKLFDHLGVRVPMIVVSPWARPHYVSHAVHDHTSALRLIELLHDLPALTGRDANADALLDMFDFGCSTLLTPPDAPAAGTKGCP